MSDFELRRALRELRQPVEPGPSVWAGIERGIKARPQQAPRSRRWTLAAAAALVLAVGAAGLALNVQRHGQGRPEEGARNASVNDRIQLARSTASTRDPRLAAPSVVLDAASAELELALQQQPNAPYLVNLINNTHAQREKLARLGSHAS